MSDLNIDDAPLGELQPLFDKWWATVHEATASTIDDAGVRFLMPAVWHGGYKEAAAELARLREVVEKLQPLVAYAFLEGAGYACGGNSGPCMVVAQDVVDANWAKSVSNGKLTALAASGEEEEHER